MAATTVDPSPLSPGSSTSPFGSVLLNRLLVDELAVDCVGYAAANGITMFHKSQLTHAPITILPATLPQRCFDAVVAAHRDFNTLYDAVSRDYDFLVQALTSSARQQRETQQRCGCSSDC
jgi:hypothetical protein